MEIFPQNIIPIKFIKIDEEMTEKKKDNSKKEK